MDEASRPEGRVETGDLIARLMREMEEVIGLLQRPYARPETARVEALPAPDPGHRPGVPDAA